jgi:hypothetical protein
MPTLPLVAVTATTQVIGESLRVRVNAAYTRSIRGAGLLPIVLPVLDPADADAALEGVAGLVLTGGEDVSPARYGAAPHPKLGGTHDGGRSLEDLAGELAEESPSPDIDAFATGGGGRAAGRDRVVRRRRHRFGGR